MHNFSPNSPPSSVFSLPNNCHGNGLMYKLVIGYILTGTILFTMNPVPQPSPAFRTKKQAMNSWAGPGNKATLVLVDCGIIGCPVLYAKTECTLQCSMFI